MRVKRPLRTFLILLLISVWFFAGWPRIWQNPQIPPKIKEARADSQEFTSTDTWTAPGSVTSVDVECWGAGGAGGGGDVKSGTGGGGGGGGVYAKTTGITVTPSTGYTVTVGVGGSGGTGDGPAGGDSSFDGDAGSVLAKGGAGGQSTSSGAGGGTGGQASASTGTTKYDGGSGYQGSGTAGGGGGESAGASSNGTSATSQTGASGVADGGDGGNGGNVNSNGDPGVAPGGGGGGGGGRTGGSKSGGSGANGKCILTWEVSNNPPSLTISQPDGVSDTVVVGQSYDITYDLSDAEDVATVDFYYDSDSSGLDGTAITGCQDQAEGTGAICSWDTTGMTPGDYYVYGIATDGVNPDVNDYSPGVITIQAAVVSVTITTDGTIAYGMMAANTSKSTLPGELNDIQTAENNGNVTENFNIKGQDSTNWTLAGTAGSDQYVHKFCNDTTADCTTPPTNYTALTTSYQALDTGIIVNGTVDIQLQITTPNPSTVFTEQSVDVTIQAVQQ